MYTIITDIIGYFGAFFNIFSFQAKKNKRLFLFQFLGSSCFTLNYIMLGAATGAIMNIVTVIRTLIFMRGEKTRKPYILILLCLLIVACTALSSGEQLLSGSLLPLIPLIGMLSTTCAMYSGNGKVIRLVQLFIGSPCWVIYNAVCGAKGGVICDSFVIVSTIVSIIRFGLDGFEKN